MDTHICQDQYCHLSGMRDLYAILRIIPTSTVADTVLIRSHIAYHSGNRIAERAEIRPSRGHSYMVRVGGRKVVVRVRDHYDHRAGVIGWTSETLCPAVAAGRKNESPHLTGQGR